MCEVVHGTDGVFRPLQQKFVCCQVKKFSLLKNERGFDSDERKFLGPTCDEESNDERCVAIQDLW